MRLPSSLTVEADYSVDVGHQSVDISGEVEITPTDVLEHLDADSVMEYYEKENSFDIAEVIKLASTQDILDLLLSEQMRGAYADVNVNKILEELQR